MPMKKQHLAITLQTDTPDQALPAFASLCAEHTCQITEARSACFGTMTVGAFYVTGRWDAVAKLENLLHTMAPEHNMLLQIERTTPAKYDPPLVPFSLYVTCEDTPENLSLVLRFVYRRTTLVHNLTVGETTTPYTHHRLQAIGLTMLMPVNTQLAELREAFILFCDEYNFDGIIEPERH